MMADQEGIQPGFDLSGPEKSVPGGWSNEEPLWRKMKTLEQMLEAVVLENNELKEQVLMLQKKLSQVAKK